MADELTTYYERYKQTYGGDGYSMEQSKETSRVLQLVDWIKACVPANGKLLDVGCGDMCLSKLLPEYRWTGIDIAPDMSSGKAIKQDLMTVPYPFPADQFDAVICSEVLEHLWDLRVVQKEIARVLKPRGHYLMSTPNYEWMDHHMSGFRQLIFNPDERHLFEHIRQYNLETHARFLFEAGFEVVDFTGADAHYGKFFEEPRNALFACLKHQGLTLEDGRIDQILGRMFPKHSHTITVLSVKK